MMKHSVKIAAISAAVVFMAAGCANSQDRVGARDTPHYYSVAAALNSPEARQVLLPGVSVRFAGGGGRIIRAGLVSNKKTNSLNKSDEEACRWAFLSAVKQFQETALKLGGHQVVNLISYYKKQPYRSASQYECHAGTMITGVALKGDIAR